MTLTVVENNLHEVLVDERPLLFHIPSTAIFEADRLTTTFSEPCVRASTTPAAC